MKVSKDTCILPASDRVTATLSSDIRHTPHGRCWSWSWWSTRPAVTSTSLTDLLLWSTATIRSLDNRHIPAIQHDLSFWSVRTLMFSLCVNLTLEKSRTSERQSSIFSFNILKIKSKVITLSILLYDTMKLSNVISYEITLHYNII